MSIKLITFDLDDTLWDTAPVIVSAEASMREWLATHASKVGELPVEHFAILRQQVLQPGLKHRISALRHRVLFHAFEEAGYSEATTWPMSFEVFLHARHLEMFPEAEPMLRRWPTFLLAW
jgi:putative hydrolase of the HAD superfamily